MIAFSVDERVVIKHTFSKEGRQLPRVGRPAPAWFTALSNQCAVKDPANRPSFSDILAIFAQKSQKVIAVANLGEQWRGSTPSV